MGKETFHYTNGEITVVWKPNACSHSTRCWKGLISVFNPRVRPWINMEGASTESIISQVKECPSGALSFFYNHKGETTGSPDTETAGLPKVEVTPNGPYLIRTECLIVHADGKEEVKTGSVALCRCGASANKPYCDGSHRSSGFEG